MIRQLMQHAVLEVMNYKSLTLQVLIYTHISRVLQLLPLNLINGLL